MVPNRQETSSGTLATEEVGEGQPSFEVFGDNIGKKSSNVLRVGFMNVGGLTPHKNTLKVDLLRQGVLIYDFDVFGIAETNLDWRMVKEEDRLYLRTKEWWESIHLSFSHNRTSPHLNIKQWGGTALFSIDQAAHRVVALNLVGGAGQNIGVRTIIYFGSIRPIAPIPLSVPAQSSLNIDLPCYFAETLGTQELPLQPIYARSCQKCYRLGSMLSLCWMEMLI
jgi:hypothetical protein